MKQLKNKLIRSFYVLCALLVTVSVFSKAKADDPSPIEQDPALSYRHAVQLTNEKRYEEALKELDKAQDLNTNYYEAKYQRAFILQLTNKTTEATSLYKELLDQRPDDAQVHVNLGSVLRKTGKIKEAEIEYRKAIECNYYQLQAHYDLANLLNEQNKLQEALKQYKVCLKLSPNDALVHNNVGVIYQKRKFYDEAQEEFVRAVQLEPANKMFERNLQLVKQEMKIKA